jgi:RHS repeat-associated protein
MPNRIKLFVSVKCFFLFLAFVSSVALGQTLPPLSADDQMGFQPFQSYHGGDIDHIGLSNGTLSLDYPFLAYPQRGQLQLSFNLFYNNQPQHTGWECTTTINNTQKCFFQWGYTPVSSQLPVEKGDVFVGWAQQVGFAFADSNVTVGSGSTATTYHYSNWSVQSADGAKHPLGNLGSRSWIQSAFDYYESTSGPFETLDATGIRENGALVTDEFQGGVPSAAQIVGPDGILGGMEDPNGNIITATAAGYNSFSLVDSLGRQIPAFPTSKAASNTDTSTCPVPPQVPPVDHAVLWSVPGPNGGTSNFKFCYASVAVNMPPPMTGAPYMGISNQMKLQSIFLPDGHTWNFQYNDPGDGSTYNNAPINYGTLTQITLPAAGTISYTYTSTGTGAGGSNCQNGGRFVASRTVNANDGTGSHTWTYSYNTVSTGNSSSPWTVTTTVTDPLGNYAVHTFNALYAQDYCPAYESETQYYQNGGTLLKTVNTVYSFNEGDNKSGPLNVVPTQVTTVWPNGLTSRVTKGYDSGFTYTGFKGGTGPGIYGKVMSESESDYGSGAAGATLRKTNTSYLALTNSTYLSANLLDLVSSKSTLDGNSCKQAETDYTYDESNYLTSYSGTLPSGTHGTPPNTVRGNPTSITEELFAAGSCPTTAQSGPTTHKNWYDTGEVYQAIDAKGNATTHSYHSAYAGAYSTETCNALGQCVSGTYDFNTGLLTTVTDANGSYQASGTTSGDPAHTTTLQYSDPMWRLTQAQSPPDTSGNHPVTNFKYPDANTVERLKSITTTLTDDSFSYFDGLGRHYKSVHASANNSTVVTTYDADGRVASVTNPYFATSDSTYGVMQTQYDGLGRVTQTTEQDGSISKVDYTQPTCPVSSDEAGKQRKSCSDGLGRLTSVFEDPNGLDYETDYQYDTLNNLTRVDQKGSAPTDSTQWRTRTFTYDSLSRLLTAHNPESGTITYSYDANGNVLTKVAPSPNQTGTATVTTNFQYDALNRLTQKSYTDGVTPTVNYLYDTATGWSNPTVTQINLIGRLSEIYTNTTNTTGEQVFSYDNLGRVILNNQCTPSNCGSGSYSVAAGYDLANNLTSLTYPSGRLITYSYNAGNLLNQVQFTQWNGSAPSGGAFNYWSASDTNFYANGVPKSWSLGNGVTESTVLNKRLQLQEETVGNPAIYNFADHVYNYGTQDNGNITSITDQLNSSRTQTFSYDSLNRLTSASESRWGLAFVDDAWGNRLQQNLTSGSAGQIQITVDGNNHIQGAPANCTVANMYCYDAAGNLLHDNLNHQYVYDGENRITQADSGATKYTYTLEGNRVRKDVSGSDSTEYLYFNGNVIAERDASTGYWTDYIWANGKRIARAQAVDNTLRIYGTRCSSCGTQYSLFYLQNAGRLANYTIRSGDKLDLTQYQPTGSHGGMVIAFTDGTNTNWNLKDQDGYYANDDGTQSTTHIRRMDLSAFAGKTVQQLAMNQENDTAAGNFFITYKQVSFTSTDGTVQPIYTGQPSSPVSSIVATSGVTGTGSQIDVNQNKAIYPSDTTIYYHANQINSSTMITAGNGWPVWQATYLPYGEEYNPQIGDEHYKFTSKERDGETGNDYFGARYNSSSMGRFLTPDPLGGEKLDPQTLNKYSYVRNNPINRIDPTGLYTCKDQADCKSKQDVAFEKARQQDLKSKDADVVRAAKAYGDPTKDNHVSVGFADLDKKGEGGNTVSTLGADDKGNFYANSDVTINSKLSGSDLNAAVGHEGSHVADAQDVAGSISIISTAPYTKVGMDISRYSSEQRAYAVSDSILRSENTSEHFACGLTDCILGRGLTMQSQVPETVDRILQNSPLYRSNGQPLSPTNQGGSVINGLTVPH